MALHSKKSGQLQSSKQDPCARWSCSFAAGSCLGGTAPHGGATLRNAVPCLQEEGGRSSKLKVAGETALAQRPEDLQQCGWQHAARTGRESPATP